MKGIEPFKTRDLEFLRLTHSPHLYALRVFRLLAWKHKTLRKKCNLNGAACWTCTNPLFITNKVLRYLSLSSMCWGLLPNILLQQLKSLKQFSASFVRNRLECNGGHGMTHIRFPERLIIHIMVSEQIHLFLNLFLSRF